MVGGGGPNFFVKKVKKVKNIENRQIFKLLHNPYTQTSENFHIFEKTYQKLDILKINIYFEFSTKILEVFWTFFFVFSLDKTK